METLQSVVWPNLDVPGDEALYVRLNARAQAELASPRIRFLDGGECGTDTFYGALTVGVWKRTSPVRTLRVELEGEGRFLVALGLHRLGHSLAWLDEREVVLEPGVPLRLPVDAWERLADGLLFLRFRARGPGMLEAVRWRTEDPAPREVRLGLVITHFNRPAQVLPAIRRIRRQVLRRPEVQGRITLTVVDNSRSLTLAAEDGVTHLPNRNYGGSGGFARGLLRLADEGYTHGLFMDDDASCEAESILRTWALLRYATSPRTAVAGALASEAEPWRLLEKGALFDGKCRALHAGKDLRNVWDLLWAERDDERPDYGGWWFFAYPIAAVERYPFPFFVRGDDVFFSLDNRFDIVTLNGVACLGEEFRVKHGPLTSYLDGRYHLVRLALQSESRGRLLRRLVSNQFLKPLMGYHYASARAFTLALRHVARGPGFFRDNLDLAAVRAEIGGWQPAEKLQPLDRRGMKLRAPPQRREGPGRRLLRILTLQGFLLPRGWLRDRVQVQEKSFHGRAEASFRIRRVLYEHWPSGTGYVAEHDRTAFFRELREFAGALREFRRRLPQLHRDYVEAAPRLASREFWREVYGIPSPAPRVEGFGAEPPPEAANDALPPRAPAAPTARAALTSRTAASGPGRP